MTTLTQKVPLSHTQNFLRLFDQGSDDSGPFGPRYNIVVGWRVRGPLDVATLQLALDDVVARHDVLRSTIVRDDEGYQLLSDPAPAHLRVRYLSDLDGAAGDRDRRAEEFLGEVEAGSYDAFELPHLRAVLGRFDDQDAVLALVVHHTVCDGWSMQLLARDIVTRYAERRGLPVEALPEAAPYQEYAEWQQATADDKSVGWARDYWREKLRGARFHGLRTDRPRSAGLPKTNPVHRFVIPAGSSAATLELARTTRSSPFMVLLATYDLLLQQSTGITDIVVPTLSAGRTEPKYAHTVGPFFNFVPLRTDLTDAGTFREVLDRIRMTCIEAMSYDLPFGQILEQAPDVIGTLMEDDQATLCFQVWQFETGLNGQTIGDLSVAEVRQRLVPQADGTDVPDGALLTFDIDPSGEIYGNIAYNANLYTEPSMVKLCRDFCALLTTVVADPDAPLTRVD